ncbi:MAG: hypothetical protein V4650_00055 [Pseudomonadota bacterium]
MTSTPAFLKTLFIVATLSFSSVSLGGPEGSEPSTAESQHASRSCPTRDQIADVVDEAANSLEKTRGLESVGSSMIFAIAQSIAGKAKEEAQQWMQGTLVERLCSSHLSNMFPQTCFVNRSFIANGGSGQGNAVIEELRFDINNLPACSYYLQVSATEFQAERGLGYLVSARDPEDLSGKTFVSAQQHLVSLGLRRIRERAEAKPALLANQAALLQMRAGSTSGATAALQSNLGCSPGLANINVRVCESLAIAVGLAKADTASGFSDLLDVYASPIGSWRRKQLDAMLGVGGIAGLTAGVSRASSAQGNQSNLTIGAFAPLGLRYTRPVSGGRGYWGLLASALDLGAIATYRKSDSESKSKTSVSSVISPGLYATYTFANSPFTVGLGYSHTFDGFEEKLSDGGRNKVGTDRALAFFGVDISLLGWSMN